MSDASSPRVSKKHRPPARVFVQWAANYQDGRRGIHRRDAWLARAGRDAFRAAAQERLLHLDDHRVRIRGFVIANYHYSMEVSLEGTKMLQPRVLMPNQPHEGSFDWSYDGTELEIHHGRLPESLKHCTFLRSLILWFVRASDSDAEVMAGLTQLRHLVIHKAPDIRPEALVPVLPQLKKLELIYHQLWRMQSSIPLMTQLRELNVHGSCNSLPDAIGDLTSLRVLDAQNCRLKRLPDRITELYSLQRLNLNLNHFEELPANMGRLQKLLSLHLQECRNLLRLPESLGQCRSLQVLDLSATRVSAIPASMNGLTKLRRLYLYSTKVRTLPSALAAQLRACGQHAPLKSQGYAFPDAPSEEWTADDFEVWDGDYSGCDFKPVDDEQEEESLPEEDTLMTASRRRKNSATAASASVGSDGVETVADLRRWFASEQGAQMKCECLLGCAARAERVECEPKEHAAGAEASDDAEDDETSEEVPNGDDDNDFFRFGVSTASEYQQRQTLRSWLRRR